ncbi:hypothetical protein GCG54_00000599 [Colletotrichum gloeosporioides]|uniref:Uncharacterized protein n=1 Tax=Colletotrichum gloeosporioides TaxID=474922 RepID=A0A8H4CI51_COLGL|nr:uncharacterized protein GCG54_00000599 [Colletotrichum gloeosporioides]KAF3804249.1 hypothetical protein GCG54_00000599 [Colletotrichum gloeosporioides]
MSPTAPSRATPAPRPFFKLGNLNVKSAIRVETRLKTAGTNGALGKRSTAPSRPPLKPAPARVDKKARVGQAGRKNLSNLPRNKSGRARKDPKILANHGDRAGFMPIAQMAVPPTSPPGRPFLPSPSLSPPPPALSQEHRPPAPSTVGTVIRKRKAPPTMLLPMRRPKPYSR